MGSSPLTRGKPSGPCLACFIYRLIPAHAGKTLSFPAWESNPQAHPRSRGENPESRSDRLLDPGSSPLTRGKRRGCRFRPSSRRLIPAHAGKTHADCHRPAPRAAHPRSRGENPSGSPRPRTCRGSSPLTRGKLAGVLDLIAIGRLIPAHAGKTRTRLRRGSRRGAHPRSRGENAAVVMSRVWPFGSSPLTRGKR